MHKRHWVHILKFSILVVLVLLSIILSIKFAGLGFDMNSIKDYMLSYGDLGILVALALTAVFASFGFPIIIPMAVCLLLFSTTLSIIIIFAALNIGAAVSFWIARFLGREYVEETFVNKHERLKRLDMKLQKHGFWTILISRIMIIIPYEAVNLFAGVSRVKFWPYMGASSIGMLPGVVLTAYFTKNLTSVNSLNFLIISVIFSAFMIIPMASKKIREHVF